MRVLRKRCLAIVNLYRLYRSWRQEPLCRIFPEASALSCLGSGIFTTDVQWPGQSHDISACELHGLMVHT